MPLSAFPVVNEVAVEDDRADRSGEAAPDNIPPGCANLSANGDAGRKVAFEVAREIEAVAETVVVGQGDTERSADRQHAFIRDPRRNGHPPLSFCLGKADQQTQSEHRDGGQSASSHDACLQVVELPVWGDNQVGARRAPCSNAMNRTLW